MNDDHEFQDKIDELHQLYPYIWCCSFRSAHKLIDQFEQKNIRQVINVSAEDHDSATKQMFKQCGIRYVWLKTHELAKVNICKRGAQVAKLIEEFSKQEKGTLVHCYAGINRSISCIVIARMICDHDTSEESLAHIQSIRSIANPMPAFLKQINKLHVQHT
jgi:protein-tyrosine phosphatase